MKNETADEEQNNGIFCYLFYGGVVIDIVLNYGLIFCYTLIIFYPCLMSLQTWKKLVQSIVFIVIQVMLWICVDVCGVSLIWSGQLGLILLHLTSTCIKKIRKRSNYLERRSGSFKMVGKEKRTGMEQYHRTVKEERRDLVKG